MVCADCGFEFFFNIATAVTGLILDEQQRLLLVTRAREPGKGLWDLPGGFADNHEAAEQALVREIKEELGLEVTSLTYLASAPNTYPYKGFTYHTIDLAFLCHVTDPHRAVVSDDVASYCFVHPRDIDMDRIAFGSTRHILQWFMSHGLDS
jgi:ADP-ribose pyrophosphatase YjhB (NUDIX family)